MSGQRPFSIRLFLPDGSPDGLRLVERSNWTGSGVVCPRALFPQAKARPEFARTGVYVLVGPSEAAELPSLYIGEGDPVLPRLEDHQRNKDFWTWLIVFVAKDVNLNKAHVQYLEARLIELAREARRCRLENGNKPQRPALSESDTADAESFLEDMLGIYPLVGLSAFERPAMRSESRPILMLKGRGISARGYETAEGFVVLKDSTGVIVEVPSMAEYIPYAVNLRRALQEQGVLIKDGTSLKLTQDFAFGSPSTAAAVLLGRNSNGRTAWTDEKGRTLKEIQEATEASTES